VTYTFVNKKCPVQFVLSCADAPLWLGVQFLANIRSLDPRLYILSFNKVRSAAESHYPSVEAVYESVYDSWNVPGVLSEWAECIGEDVDRPISLIIWGPLWTGKTEWARSLGNHVFMSGVFDLSA